MGPLVSGTKGPMNSHAIHIRCEFVNIEALSQIMGANLNRFNPLRLCIRGLKKIEVKTQNMETTMCKAQRSLPFSFYGYHSVSMIM